MDVLVMLEENPEHSPVLAHVNSVPSPLNSERPSREVVTLYGVPSTEALALALAAAVESYRGWGGGVEMIRHIGVWPERGALGDAAWRDQSTGQLVSRDVDIPLATLHETSRQLLLDSGHLIRRLVAGLMMPDWPEGARRAISFSLTPAFALGAAASARMDTLLDTFRESDGWTYDADGD